jgi:tubulin polyglutamylase TTLL6/13
MYNIARKNTLAMHLRRFLKEFPDHYNFFPKTWIYPADSHEIAEYNSKKYRKRNEEIA